MMQTQELPPHLAAPLRTIASGLNVSAKLHAADYIFRWLYDDPAKPDKAAVLREYLEGGAHTAKFVADLIGQFRGTAAPFTMLEFASGYGRVTRHWCNALPAADVVACDIHAEAVDFLQELGCRASLSASVPEKLALERKFDVVFALSFFTHMPRSTWGRWLSALARCTAPSGLLVFTTHGMPALKHMGVTALEPDGFWFGALSEQKDLSTQEYGATASSFNFVFRNLESCGLDLLSFREAGMGYQDLYVAAPCRNVG
jgi:SAM-dependent methyltransferase